jgi:hypothetical protein
MQALVDDAGGRLCLSPTGFADWTASARGSHKAFFFSGKKIHFASLNTSLNSKIDFI